MSLEAMNNRRNETNAAQSDTTNNARARAPALQS